MKPESSGRLSTIVTSNIQFDLELRSGQNETQNMTAYKIPNNEQLVWGFGIKPTGPEISVNLFQM